MTLIAVSPITVNAAIMIIRPVTMTTATPRSVKRQLARREPPTVATGVGIGITHARAAELAGRLSDRVEIG